MKRLEIPVAVEQQWRDLGNHRAILRQHLASNQFDLQRPIAHERMEDVTVYTQGHGIEDAYDEHFPKGAFG